MGKWIHRIVDGQCVECGPVELVVKSLGQRGTRLVCPNGTSVRHPSRFGGIRAIRMEALPPFEGRCEICGDPLALEDAHVDHDHKTGTPRGFLCRGCNLGLGHFRDNPDNLRLAIAYLGK